MQIEFKDFKNTKAGKWLLNEFAFNIEQLDFIMDLNTLYELKSEAEIKSYFLQESTFKSLELEVFISKNEKSLLRFHERNFIKEENGKWNFNLKSLDLNQKNEALEKLALRLIYDVRIVLIGIERESLGIEKTYHDESLDSHYDFLPTYYCAFDTKHRALIREFKESLGVFALNWKTNTLGIGS